MQADRRARAAAAGADDTLPGAGRWRSRWRHSRKMHRLETGVQQEPATAPRAKPTASQRRRLRSSAQTSSGDMPCCGEQDERVEPQVGHLVRQLSAFARSWPRSRLRWPPRRSSCRSGRRRARASARRRRPRVGRRRCRIVANRSAADLAARFARRDLVERRLKKQLGSPVWQVGPSRLGTGRSARRHRSRRASPAGAGSCRWSRPFPRAAGDCG